MPTWTGFADAQRDVAGGGAEGAKPVTAESALLAGKS
jgi:hypothetical protein